MSKSIADGAKLTPETFADFIERLKYHHCGEGVSRHITADPIFMVQKESTIYGMDTDYCDGRFVAFEDSVWFSPQEYWDDLDDDEQADLNAECEETYDTPFTDLSEDTQWSVLEDLENHTVSGFKKEWQHVNAHFTREAAEAFIRRKQHDYPPLRVYVESMYFGWEYREIIKALCDGRLVLVDTQEAAQ
ncbi:gluconate 2-dehydrogenase subunit 3 family protein [Citrobacter werkmanii]|uniref:gluconate 2-dehydrogenase subunit 3 family protein n=1 Tax=Citrobacter werkmanii TaxID=67827 RepID=UPI00295547FE|nr:gluconate 2-dehydrogenase subunit 3 family protein [Citrobacter werkmanii]MDV7070451.1 gluconate 2-dehydrogenase subunit 3 family protein [Citrobacter werkmanii]